MKRLFRSRTVQAALAAAFAAYLRATLRTLRWRRTHMELAESVWDEGGGVLVCFWHGRIALSPACWPLDRAQEPRALISLSPDGQFIAGAVERLGFPAIRGSAARSGAEARSKGGSGAFRDVLRWISKGGGVAVTPDGPRGPAEEMSGGVPLLARASGAPVLLVGLACAPCLRLKSWDRAQLPLPFSRGAIVWGLEAAPDRNAGPDELEAARRSWGERLSVLTRQAEGQVT